MPVVMEDVLGQDLLEVPATEDEKPVQALAAYRANKALRHRIRPWGSHRRLQYPDAVGTEHVVEADSELRVPVPDEELDRTGALGQYETQVAGLLGHPLTGRVGSDTREMDTPRVEVDKNST